MSFHIWEKGHRRTIWATSWSDLHQHFKDWRVKPDRVVKLV